jgi:hypothetical protein
MKYFSKRQLIGKKIRELGRFRSFTGEAAAQTREVAPRYFLKVLLKTFKYLVKTFISSPVGL